MTLAEIRKEIDEIDPQIKALFLQRMEVAKHVAEVKYASGDEIYKADREAEIISRLTVDVAPELKMEYTAFIRKIMEVARKYEYGLIYDWNPEVAAEFIKDAQESQNGYVKVRMVRPNQVNSMSSILSMIGDYGFHMKQITLQEENTEEVKFELVICGDINTEEMKKLIYQLSKESKDFEVL
ncbi:MAG: chorismate mutase [bacterium]|nr:chorismate mutase [bacterium]